MRNRRGHDRMVVGFTTLYVISTYHYWCAESSWPWSYGSWIYNSLCNQYLSLLILWVRISIRAWCTTLCDKVCKWLATGRWFSLGPTVSSTNKTDHHNITEIVLKVALNIIKKNKQTKVSEWASERFLCNINCFCYITARTSYIFDKMTMLRTLY